MKHVVDYNLDLGNSPLEVSQDEKYLRVLVPYDLMSETNSVINASRENFALITLSCCPFRQNFYLIFNSLNRPHSEYGNIVHLPSLQKKEDSLERIQKRAVKSVWGLEYKPYKGRL